jgi:alginate O-acetyltransferase complex protein AlgI
MVTFWHTGLRKVTTFVLVIIGWVLFRSTNFSMASGLLTAMFSWKPGIHLNTGKSLVGLLLVAAALAHFGPNTFELRHQWSPVQSFALGALLLACIVFIYAGQQSPFLYFQF